MHKIYREYFFAFENDCKWEKVRESERERERESKREREKVRERERESKREIERERESKREKWKYVIGFGFEDWKFFFKSILGNQN